VLNIFWIISQVNTASNCKPVLMNPP